MARPNTGKCTEAQLERARKYRKKNHVEVTRKRRIFQRKHRKRLAALARKVRLEARLACFDYYGHTCFCCKESRKEFLGFDHINGDGAEHRRTIGKGVTLPLWLKRNNFPEGFRTACHNCNLAMGFYGYCPHQKERDEKAKSKED